jgi:hypothetical protein
VPARLRFTNDFPTMSLFTWLDYSEHERRKMLDVVDLFKERDTRDELGLGAIRDSFADQFFPGTSTIMTRARYFLLVAWTYRRLEARKVGSGQIADRARKAETDLIEAIERSSDKEGNIGKYARTALKRLPSSVYWQGLWVWGIRTFPGAQTQYHRSLDRFYAQIERHGGRKEERDAEHDDLAVTNWNPGLIPPPDDFPEQCSLRLSRVEAEYLSERIRLGPLAAGSLLAELVGRKRRCDPVPFVWHHPLVGEMPAKIKEKLLHAQNFAEVMHGAALLYNLILAEQAKWEEGIATYRDELKTWVQKVSQRSAAIRSWNRARFWEIARSGNTQISAGATDFVNAWLDFTLNNAKSVSTDRGMRQLITDREKRLKKNLARIDNPRAQELWQGDSGSAQLDYRWAIGHRIITDIFDGMEVSGA